MDNHKWAEKEIQALINAGVNPLDAQRSVNWTLTHMPPNADPAKWIPAASDLDTPVDKASVQDAAAVWFERVKPKYKRLLNATVRK